MCFKFFRSNEAISGAGVKFIPATPSDISRVYPATPGIPPHDLVDAATANSTEISELLSHDIMYVALR